MNGGKRMGKQWKKALREAYRAPDPAGKASFLKRYRRRELSWGELVAVQAGYIRWWVWALSLALSGFILLSLSGTAERGLWGAAAFTPFLALLAVAENGRSRLYGMDELERACRMARQSVLLARMAALGLFHLALLAGLTPALAAWGAVGAVRAGVYLLTPYLLTAALGMELTRRVRGRECLIACGSAAALVSGLGMLLVNMSPELYRPDSLRLWLTALCAAALGAGWEVFINLRRTEEIQWN